MVATSRAEVLAGRYRLGGRLGAGGMAEVYAARDLRLGRDVAIKMLWPDLGADPLVRERFEREACAAARISHPNVVGLLDIGEDEGVAFLIMERMEGTTLADELCNGPLDPARVREEAVQVLEALEAAHRSGVVHGDVKPANILTCHDGRVKVADFGIATALDETTPPLSTDICGTPAYLAPERLSGEPSSPASDLYSLGAVLYECLTGRRAASFGERSERLAPRRDETRHLAVELPWARSPELCEVVERCLEPDAMRRPRSCRAMVRLLEGWADLATLEVRLPEKSDRREVERARGPRPHNRTVFKKGVLVHTVRPKVLAGIAFARRRQVALGFVASFGASLALTVPLASSGPAPSHAHRAPRVHIVSAKARPSLDRSALQALR